MNKTAVSTHALCLLQALAMGAALTSGCGSDSTATATFPRTPTPPSLRQQATPQPTATAIPGD